MSLPNHIAPAKRSALGKRWAAAKAAKRLVAGVDAETLYRRALYDARGTVTREGVVYQARRVTPWAVRRSAIGRTDQLDLLQGQRIRTTAGPRQIAHILHMPRRTDLTAAHPTRAE